LFVYLHIQLFRSFRGTWSWLLAPSLLIVFKNVWSYVFHERINDVRHNKARKLHVLLLFVLNRKNWVIRHDIRQWPAAEDELTGLWLQGIARRHC
jgi:hypothetical protein